MHRRHRMAPSNTSFIEMFDLGYIISLEISSSFLIAVVSTQLTLTSLISKPLPTAPLVSRPVGRLFSPPLGMMVVYLHRGDYETPCGQPVQMAPAPPRSDGRVKT